MSGGVAALVESAGFAPEGRPARLNSADQGLVEQVKRWRAQGMGWDGVGRALRRSTPDVRTAFDPTYLREGPTVVALARVQPSKAAEVITPRKHGRRGEIPAPTAAVMLAMAGCDEATPMQIADAIGNTTNTAVSAHLTRMKARGWAVKARPEAAAGWRLTAKGDVIVRRLQR